MPEGCIHCQKYLVLSTYLIRSVANHWTVFFMQLLHPRQQSAVQIVAYVWDARGSEIPRTRNIAQRVEKDRIDNAGQLVCKILDVVSRVARQQARRADNTKAAKLLAITREWLEEFKRASIKRPTLFARCRLVGRSRRMEVVNKRTKLYFIVKITRHSTPVPSADYTDTNAGDQRSKRHAGFATITSSSNMVHIRMECS